MNPNLQASLITGGAGALGSAIGGPLGSAIGAGSVPIAQSLFTPQQEPWGQVLTQAGISALGAGLGSAVIPGGIGGGLGGAAGGYLGRQVSQGQLFNGAYHNRTYNGVAEMNNREYSGMLAQNMGVNTQIGYYNGARSGCGCNHSH